MLAALRTQPKSPWPAPPGVTMNPRPTAWLWKAAQQHASTYLKKVHCLSQLATKWPLQTQKEVKAHKSRARADPDPRPVSSTAEARKS